MGLFDRFKKAQTTKAANISIPNDWPKYLPSNFIPISGLNSKVDNLIMLYNIVPEINAIITYIAQNAATVPAKHVKVQKNQKEKDVNNSAILTLLNNPNEFESGKILKFNAFTFYYVTGNSYLNTLVPVGFSEPSKLYCLPSNKVYPITNQSIEPYGEPKPGTDPRLNEITKYNWDLTGKFIAIEPKDMFHFKDSSLSSWTTGTSRLSAAVDSIESLRGLNETLNTVLNKAGALGFIKKNRKPNDPGNVMAPTEKERLEAKFYSYGALRGKQPYILTDEDLSFVRILSQLSDFMPIEIKDSEFKTLCQVLGGFPDVLLKATDTTFANMKTAEKVFYTNIVKPLLDGFYEGFTNKCKQKGWIGEDEAIMADYSEIESLQEDKKTKYETEKLEDELWINRYKNGLITLNQLLEALELDKQTNGDTYYEQRQTEQNQGTGQGQEDQSQQQ